MNNATIDVQTIGQNMFKRFKTWADLLKRITENASGMENEIDLNGISNTLSDNDDELDENDGSMAEEDDGDDEGFEVSRQVGAVRNQTVLMANVGAESVPIKIDDNFVEDKCNDIDMLNQTVPVLIEYERKLRLEGLDEILNSFDVTKIENTVGGWLGRQDIYCDKCHHSVGPHRIDIDNNNTSTSLLPVNGFGKRKTLRYVPPDECYSESDSLHSVDTARYILSSRNRQRSSQHRSTSSCTTMAAIKTFCTQQSRRDALREKYNCPDQNDDVLINELRSRRTRFRHYYDASLSAQSPTSFQPGNKPMLVRSDKPTGGAKSRYEMLHRRKHCRKRRLKHDSISPCYNSSSSDNSDCDQNYRPQRVVPSLASHRWKSLKERIRHRAFCCSGYLHNRSHSSSKSSYSFNHSIESSDGRPCKRESDCHCSKRGKLCSKIRHLADNSTEEWLVENSDAVIKSSSHQRLKSPKKLKRIRGTENTAAPPSKTSKIKKNYVAREKAKVSGDSIEPHNEKKAVCPVVENNAKEPTADKAGAIKKATNKSANNKKKQAAAGESTAITKGTIKKVTKKIDESEKRQAVAKVANKKTREKLALGNKNVTSEKSKSGTETNESFDRDLKMVIKLSMETYEMEQKSKQLHSMQNATVQNVLSKCAQQAKEGAIEQAVLANPSPTQVNVAKTKKQTATLTAEYSDKPTVSNDLNDTVISILPKLKPQPYSAKMRKMKKYLTGAQKPEGTEDTFCNNAHNMCNSTALANHSAQKRQICTSLSAGTLSPNSRARTSATIAEDQVLGAQLSNKSATKTGAHLAREDSTKAAVSSYNATPRSRWRRNPQSSDDDDCTLVTSTTVNQQKQLQQRPADKSTQDILLYTPHNRALVPEHSFDNGGYFNITKEHLSTVIGEKRAEKFMRFYQGRRRFDASSTVYYRPPQSPSSAETTDDEADILELVEKYGELHESRQ